MTGKIEYIHHSFADRLSASSLMNAEGAHERGVSAMERLNRPGELFSRRRLGHGHFPIVPSDRVARRGCRRALDATCILGSTPNAMGSEPSAVDSASRFRSHFLDQSLAATDLVSV